MFALALLTGVYSYLVFIIGLLGFLNRPIILLVSFLFIIGSTVYFYFKKEDLPQFNFKNKKIRPLLLLFCVLAFVNLIGVMVPEYSFDALWYHLSLPKIFLEEGRIFAVTEGIFYYSVMPKLGEMLFTPFVAFNLEVFAKLTQWIFGILTSFVIYKIARRYFDEKKSFFAVLVFYGSLVVAWESTVAYVDLIRAFFEVMALWGFLIWSKTKDRKIFIESSIFIGLAISTKLFALGTIPIFVLFIFLAEKDRLKALKDSIFMGLIALVSASPWFIISFLETRNPIFPIFSHSYSEVSFISLFFPQNVALDIYNLFLKSSDPISPLFIIFLPLLIFTFRKFSREQKLVAIYFLSSLLIWYFIPRLGGGRFILPYLPAASILVISIIENLDSKSIKKYSYLLIIFVFFLTIAYRGIAVSRHIPVIVGVEEKSEFMKRNLNFHFGDFYDIDSYFAKNITEKDKVLLVGFHNIYYINFPFVHESYIKLGDKFNYIAVQDSELPIRFGDWKRIYINETTGVSLYSNGGEMWEY